MHRMTPTAESPAPAPLAKDERIDAVRRILSEHGIMLRRAGHAQSVGLTITYAHLSEAADGPMAVALLVAALAWEETTISLLPGCVAVTTERG